MLVILIIFFPSLDHVPSDVNQTFGPNYVPNDVDIHDFTKLLTLDSFQHIYMPFIYNVFFGYHNI
jgi:hypothetical protein